VNHKESSLVETGWFSMPSTTPGLCQGQARKSRLEDNEDIEDEEKETMRTLKTGGIGITVCLTTGHTKVKHEHI
jgi:hypothetical protein